MPAPKYELEEPITLVDGTTGKVKVVHDYGEDALPTYEVKVRGGKMVEVKEDEIKGEEPGEPAPETAPAQEATQPGAETSPAGEAAPADHPTSN